GSQLVQIDLETRLPHTVFPSPSVPLPGRFFTSTAGHLDVIGPDRVLVAPYAERKLWEINLTTGIVLWEYILVEPEEPHFRRHLNTAKYVRDVDFPFNRTGTSRP